MLTRKKVNPLLLGLAALITVLNISPLLWIALSAFKTRLEIFTQVILPSHFNFNNFSAIFEKDLPYLLNTLIITVLATLGILIVAIPASFALSAFNFKRKYNLEMWILSTRMMPPIAAALPFFFALKLINLFDTLPGLILVYIGVNLPFAIWLLTSFMRQIPSETIEAARVDGCTWWQVLRSIAFPMSSSGTATVAVFSAIFCWNELLLPLFLTNGTAKTFTVVLTEFKGQTNTVWEQMSAGALVQIIPIVVMTFFVQRYIVSGLTMGAIK